MKKKTLVLYFRTPFYRGADVCMLTYAIDDRESFELLTNWKNEFLKYADINSDNFPFIVVGNKVTYLKEVLMSI